MAFRISSPFALQSATVTLGVAAATLIKPCFIFSSSRVLSLALSYDPLKIFHGKIIILIAEMAIHLNVLAFLDHLVKFFSSDADQRFFHTLSAAVAMKLCGQCIIDLYVSLPVLLQRKR